MSDLERYLEYSKYYPKRFANQLDGIEILLDREQIQQVEELMAERLAKLGLPSDWAKVGVAFQDQYLMILRDAVRFPGGQLGTYIRMTGLEDPVPGVIILPVYQEQIVLVRHFRHAARDWLMEIPRGFGEPEQSPSENARRELKEEIGGIITNLIPLGRLQIDAGLIGSYDELFYAELSAIGNPEASEGITSLHLVTFSEFGQMIADGKITDGYTLAAYARAKAKGLL